MRNPRANIKPKDKKRPTKHKSITRLQLVRKLTTTDCNTTVANAMKAAL